MDNHSTLVLALCIGIALPLDVLAQAPPTANTAANRFVESRQQFAQSVSKLRQVEDQWRATGEQLRKLADCPHNANRAADVRRALETTARFEAVGKNIRTHLDHFEKQSEQFTVPQDAQVNICTSGPTELSGKFQTYEAAARDTYGKLFMAPDGKAPEDNLAFRKVVQESRANLDRSVAEFESLCKTDVVSCMAAKAGACGGVNPASLFTKAKAKLRELEQGYLGGGEKPGVQQNLHSLITATGEEKQSLSSLAQRCTTAAQATKP